MVCKWDKGGWDCCKIGEEDKAEDKEDGDEACNTDGIERSKAEMGIETGEEGGGGGRWLRRSWHNTDRGRSRVMLLLRIVVVHGA